MNWKLVLLLCLLFTLTNSLLGQTQVSGNVSGEWTIAGSPYIVVGSCTVPLGLTLTIHAGVQVKFDGDFYIQSYGTLIADGSVSDTIVFTSNDPSPGTGDWRYIWIRGTGATATRLQYCRLTYGRSGVYVDDSEAEIQSCEVRLNSQSGVRISSSTATVNGCHISDNNNWGILATGGSSVTIQNCDIAENSDDGIKIDGSYGLIEWNMIHGNSLNGIYLFSAGEMVLRRNVINVNTWSGIYATNTYSIVAWHNDVTQNTRHGVFFFNSPLTMGNSIVDRNGLNGLYNQNSSFTFLYNDVWSNGQNYVDCTAGPWDFSDNPQYVNASNDFHLQEGSLCIDAGSPVSELDPDGTRADVGVFYFDQNHPPEILDFGPATLDSVEQNVDVNFWISAYDQDGDSLRYEWWHWDELVGTDSALTIQFSELGVHRMVSKVLDGWGGGVDSVYWHFIVHGIAVPMSRGGYLPKEIWLGNAYPNPFNSSVVIPFCVYHSAKVKVALYDILGQEVAVLFDQQVNPGEHRVYWEARGLASGIYFVVLQSSNETRVGKIVKLN